MYSGNNPTALQSQKMIADALLELMENKEFAKINIKELCAKAQVSRQTFYTLFDNKVEVIGLHLDILFDTYVDKYLQSKNDYVLKELCDNTIIYLVENKKLIQMMVKSNLDYLVKNKLENYLSSLSNLMYPSRQDKQNYAIAFLSGGLMNVISLAVKNDDFEDGDKMSELMESILSGEYFQAQQ